MCVFETNQGVFGVSTQRNAYDERCGFNDCRVGPVSYTHLAVNVFINTMAGYSLSRLSFPGRDQIYHLLLALMMVPNQVLLIPNYRCV